MQRDDGAVRSLLLPASLVRQGMRALLGAESTVQVAGETDGVALARKIGPDVILLYDDGSDTLDKSCSLCEQLKGWRVVVVGFPLDRERVIRWMQTGALGFVSQTAEPGDLAAASRGGLTLSHDIIGMLVQRLRSAA